MKFEVRRYDDAQVSISYRPICCDTTLSFVYDVGEVKFLLTVKTHMYDEDKLYPLLPLVSSRNLPFQFSKSLLIYECIHIAVNCDSIY